MQLTNPTAYQSMSSDSNIVPDDHVALVLIEQSESSFYLRIPLTKIRALCLKPLKYLLYLGWCILGGEGVLSLRPDIHDGIDTDEDADGGETYYYVLDEPLDPTQVVDLDLIKARTETTSESSATCDSFRTALLKRDIRCVWTGTEYAGDGMHIIPYKRGSEWFRLIVENRPSYDEEVESLEDINDIRNGVFASMMINRIFDQRLVAILKTPNHILETEDIPPRCDRTDLQTDVSYPSRSRYTLQWLIDPPPGDTNLTPNNSDAAFKKRTKKAKPSDLLLHYMYGAAAVRRWGRGTAVLTAFTTPPRPEVPVPAPAGPTKTMHDRRATILKRSKAQSTGETGAGSSKASKAGAGTGGLVESEGQAIWDEDDVMLFFWGNSKAAKERHLKKVGENITGERQPTAKFSTSPYFPITQSLIKKWSFVFTPRIYFDRTVEDA
ncbi:uncharacterized protein LACBIDRAFT_294884 [Laccaria bicolor S238N-H82]|uniref:Predicted protein n=1 Tax=Laccaria bicolor (strain S238N-H82 / ATCC MYA-4686) TaxID=486041 RepID=B0DJR9_LACBS|nr:uncharacterized protein LACBIDRAFT_294884 [Laccaria bicolor S238N-H82]EDR05166.1 predicted protein [Laccaria bicolor S238N-H82]|eukprot:XP_001884131.1 predicted protein [Laccaria bicolor S238N-H82]